MTAIIKKSILNMIMAASVLTLLTSSIVAIDRFHDKRTYEELAEQRASQLAGEADSLQSQHNAVLSEEAENILAMHEITGSQEAAADKVNQARLTSDQMGQSDQIPGLMAESGETAFNQDDEAITQTANPYIYKENKNKAWLAVNSDYMGWLQIPGTNIDYPFVRSQDNIDYLTRDFYGQTSRSGTLFMDYRNLGNFNDRHTIIYGHNMRNKTMFHNLSFYQDAVHFAEYPLIHLSGLYDSRTYLIFSVYVISADEYALTLNFENDHSYVDYLNELRSSSLHQQDIMLNADDRLLTLVTCSYDVNNGRTIVHAVEITDGI